MFVKQIDVRKALELAAKGREIMVMAPTTPEPAKWMDYEPDTLSHILEGCLFFRKEPAMESDLVGEENHAAEVGSVEQKETKPDPPPVRNQKNKLKVDTGKLMALRKAGWSVKKIAEELKISEGSVYNYLKKMEGEHDETSDSRTSERD